MLQKVSSRAAFIMVFLLLILTPLSPMADFIGSNAEAAGSTRHIYSFSDGSVENIALYQGGGPDTTTMVSLPKGAEVLDVELTLSGASSTGWSQVTSDSYEDWMDGNGNNVDSRSEELTLGFDSAEVLESKHKMDDEIQSASTAWLDNGSFSIRQPHTANSTETRFSEQVKITNTNLMAQGQGAILRNHDKLFMSTWSGSSFDKVVQRMNANNMSKDIVVDLQQGSCTLPSDPASTYYKSYAFRDWAVTDDEIMYGIFSTYKYFYSTSAPTQHHRVLKIDISDDWTWKCLDSYDIAPGFGEYTGIGYDRVNDKIWVAHGQQRRIVSYEFGDNGQFTRGQDMYSFTSSSSSNTACGQSTSMVRGLEAHDNFFYMRCMKGTYYQDTDQISAWAISGSSASLVPQSGTRDISALGNGLVYDGDRLLTVDCGYSSWQQKTLYYRELGIAIEYKTTPAPGTTTWIGETISTTDDVLAVNVRNHWSALSQGDRVDYWVSSDNGTHWEAVEKNQTIHFANPGKELVWKLQLIGSSAVSWWVNLEYTTEYSATGDWTSQVVNTGTEVGKARAVWVADVPPNTDLVVMISNDNGSSWQSADNNVEVNFPSSGGGGNEMLYNIQMSTTYSNETPKLDSFTLWYEEGYPDGPSLDIGDDNIWDWRSIIFLNESDIVASDDSPVGSVVSEAPGLVAAFNSHIPENGIGTVEIPIAVKARTPGRIKLTQLDIEYRLNTHVLDASLEGGLITPDGIYRNLVVRVGHGDEVDRVTEAVIGLDHSYGDNPAFKWIRGDTCNVEDNASEIINFDVGNCTSVTDDEGIVSITMPLEVNWTWDDERKMEAIVSANDELGVQVQSWTTDTLELNVENDIQLDGMRVWEETGRELYPGDWVRGGFNLSIAGGLHFENSAFSPQAGEFSIRVLAQNITHDGDPIGEPTILHQEGNPAFGQYNITFQSPIESAPGGMVLYVQAVDLHNSSTFTNPEYNTIKLIFDGNSPLVLFASPLSGSQMHVGAPAPGGQSVELIIQDSVDPPQVVDLHYWIGCEPGDHESCSDLNFNGLPEENEYRSKSLTTPETKAGGMNIFNGLIDDSMLLHGDRIAFYVSGEDSQHNQIAMGGGPVCADGPPYCGDKPGEIPPDWDNSLSWYSIRQEFEPVMDVDNSTILGHDDKTPLHPGTPYIATFTISDINGWSDVEYIQLALAGDFDDDETSIFALLSSDAKGMPSLHLESGGSGLAVSNLYSNIFLDPTNNSRMIVSIKFQLTWNFPEVWDTDGESYFIPKVWIEDKPCGLESDVPCNTHKAGLGNDMWSLDNDLRFDTQQGHLLAIELRDSTNHYNPEFDETLIGAGQVIRFSGRVLFSEDETPAPQGAFDIVLGDYDQEWVTSSRDGGYFSIDFLVPDVRSGHLDLRAKLADLPGLATDESEFNPRLRLAVDSERPTINTVTLDGILAGENVPISRAGNLQVMVETRDDQGFNADNPAILHYLVRAGEAEISRGSAPLPETTPFEDQFFWTGYLDLTDGGATMLLPSYTIDVWVTGSDASGNPYDSVNNQIGMPIASWPLALTGPDVSLKAADTIWWWSDPSPAPGDAVSLTIESRNSGATGEVSFVLQRRVGGDDWNTLDEKIIEMSSGKKGQVRLETIADGTSGQTLEHRLLLLDSGVEKERISISPLILTDDVERDGVALANQVAESQLSVIMYLIALGAMSYAVFAMVKMRKLQREEEVEPEDQTGEVLADLEGSKEVPAVPDVPDMTAKLTNPPSSGQGPPIPESGLPDGWTEDQWMHYGEQYLKS